MALYVSPGYVHPCVPRDHALQTGPDVIKVRYAQKVKDPGVYLGFADLALLTIARQKATYVMVYDDELEGQPKCDCILEMLNRHLEGTNAPMFELPAGSYDSETAWVLLCCRMDFERAAFVTLNHFAPMFSEAAHRSLQVKHCSDHDAASRSMQEQFSRMFGILWGIHLSFKTFHNS